MIEKNKEDYLRTIYHIQEESKSDEGVSSIDVSKYLNISKASVSEMLKKLKNEKLIDLKLYGKIKLTKKGLVEAKIITRKHRIIEVFLTEFLSLKNEKIHEEANRLEHAFSDESIDSIYELIKNNTICPHGKKIPEKA